MQFRSEFCIILLTVFSDRITSVNAIYIRYGCSLDPLKTYLLFATAVLLAVCLSNVIDKIVLESI